MNKLYLLIFLIVFCLQTSLNFVLLKERKNGLIIGSKVKFKKDAKYAQTYNRCTGLEVIGLYKNQIAWIELNGCPFAKLKNLSPPTTDLVPQDSLELKND